MDANEFIVERHGKPQNDMEAEQFMEMAEMMGDFAQMKCIEQKNIDIAAAKRHGLVSGIRNAPLATDK